MKTKTIIITIVLLSMAIVVAQTVRLHLEDGQGELYWSHSGNGMDGKAEDEVAFEVILKNLTDGSMENIMQHPYPPPTIDDPMQLLIPVDMHSYDVGIVAYDAVGNRSDTTWAEYALYTFVPDTIPPEPCGLIVCTKR